MYRLADPAVPGKDKLDLVENTTADEAGTIDRFAAALRDDGVPGGQVRAIRVALQRLPIQRWSRTMQDVAFFAAYRHGAGARHWYLKNSPCNALGGM